MQTKRAESDLTVKHDWEEGLPTAARTLRELLRDVDSASVPLWSGQALDAAIHRYVEIFLPMLAAHAGLKRVSRLVSKANEKLLRAYQQVIWGVMYRRKLDEDERKQFVAPFSALGNAKNVAAIAPIPPLDVAFCWALHRLSPLDYAADCTQLFGEPLPTDNGLDYIGVHNAEKERAVTARLQWTSFARAVRTREGWRPFHQKACRRERKTFLPSYLWPRFEKDGKMEGFEFTEKHRGFFEPNWTSPLRYNLVAAASRQKQFLFNISGEYFDSDAALERGVKRYKQFLTLMRDNPGKFLVPMYDIDLVWHAHILRNTEAYAKCTRKFVGRFVNHKEDDDRKSGGELDHGFKRTVELWREAYDEEYEDCDTNYKGRIPDSVERIFVKDRAVIIKSADDWRKSFIEEIVCEKCKDKTKSQMCGTCGRDFMNKVRLERSAQVKGGACAALYQRGFIGSVAMYSVAGGACGGTIGDSYGASGCGSGQGANCGGGCGNGGGGCSAFDIGGAGGCGGGCGGGGCGGGGCGC